MKPHLPESPAKKNVNRLAGHELPYEGNISNGGGSWRAGPGVSRCRCGEESPVLPNATARKRWHREHKNAVRLGSATPGVSPITPADDEAFVRALTSPRTKWCRARLLHALSGAAKQGVLDEVVDELLEDDGDEVKERLVNALVRTGWLPAS